MNLLDSWFKMDVGEGAFYAVFGLVFVFLGIVLLILILSLIGLVMRKIEEARRRRHEKKIPAAPALPDAEEGIPPEVVAAISAAVAVCLREENAKCEFVVRRIKRI